MRDIEREGRERSGRIYRFQGFVFSDGAEKRECTRKRRRFVLSVSLCGGLMGGNGLDLKRTKAGEANG
jgi:hypothetical protein